MEIIKNTYSGENIYLSEYSCALSYDASFDLFYDRSSFNSEKNNMSNIKMNLHNERLDISSLSVTKIGVLYLLFDIEAVQNSRVILNTAMPVNSKIFLNNNLLTVIGIDTIDHNIKHKSNYVCFNLKKGTNHFIVEILNPESQVQLNMLLMNYENEVSDNYYSISQIGNYSNHMDFNYVCECIFTNHLSGYSFMVMANNDVFTDKYEIFIYDQFGKLKISYQNVYGKKECLDLLALSKDNDSVFQNYFIIIKSVRKDGTYYAKSFPVVLHNPVDMIPDILSRVDTYLHKQESASEIDLVNSKLGEIVYASNNYGELTTYIQCYNLYYMVLSSEGGQKLLYDEIRENCERLHSDNKLKTAVIKNIEYCSEIDLCKERILIRLPHNYDDNKKYPLILNLAIGRYSWDSYKLHESEIAGSFIFADISIRGQTLGGYMGEANVLESLSKIEDQFSIDKEHIYIQGASNAGYAVWRLLGKLPHIFAAGYPLAAIPAIHDINNMSNVPIITLLSDMDSAWFGKDMLLYLDKFSGIVYYKQINVKGIVHSQLINYVVNHKVIKFFLNYSLNTFPHKIVYITNSNRYRKAYWLELHEICFGAKEATIIAEFNNAGIDIMISNVEGIDISIPPQINRDYFTVNINNEPIHIVDYDLSMLHFRLYNNTKKYMLCDCTNKQWRPASRKGYGLLDIYFDKIRVMIPVDSSQSVRKVAENLAHPHSNANDGDISVSYPVMVLNDAELEVWGDNSIICICCNNVLPSGLKPKSDLYIDTFIDGFSYMGINHNGKYSVMQIVPNPINPEYSILYIDTNDPDSLEKNLFLRKMIIPGEFTGHHPYLNNEALVLLDGSYYSVYEWGEELKPV